MDLCECMAMFIQGKVLDYRPLGHGPGVRHWTTYHCVLKHRYIGITEYDFHVSVGSQWNRIKCRPSPPPLKGHSACVVTDKMLIHGGSSQGSFLNTLWCFHFGMDQSFYPLHQYTQGGGGGGYKCSWRVFTQTETIKENF